MPDASYSPNDIEPYVIFRVLAGSRAFGLATETSDEDRRGIYLPPAEWHWSLTKPPEQIESKENGVEETLWELEKYLRLALNANPNILEALWSPIVLKCDDIGSELREMRHVFLSRRLHRTYSGYVVSQFRLMEQSIARRGTFKVKHAMHLLRLLLSGIHALKHGEILVDVGEHREELLAVRRGETTFDEIRERMLELNEQFGEAFRDTSLPEEPDIERVNDFLIASRRKRT